MVRDAAHGLGLRWHHGPAVDRHVEPLDGPWGLGGEIAGAMRRYGRLARQLEDLPDGAQVEFVDDE
jgi:hypothetical protein